MNKTLVKTARIPAIILAVIVITSISYAQPPVKDFKERREQINAQKIGFLTKELDLTPAVAEKFWPVYNEYETKKEELHKMFFENHRPDMVDISELSDEEAAEKADNFIIMDQKSLDLKKEYYLKLKEILTPQQILQLYRAEKEFQRFLLEKIRTQGPEKQRSKR